MFCSIRYINFNFNSCIWVTAEYFFSRYVQHLSFLSFSIPYVWTSYSESLGVRRDQKSRLICLAPRPGLRHKYVQSETFILTLSTYVIFFIVNGSDTLTLKDLIFCCFSIKNIRNKEQNFPTRRGNFSPGCVSQRSNLGSNFWNENVMCS